MQEHLKKVPLILSAMVLIILSATIFLLYEKINSNTEKANITMAEVEDENNKRYEVKLLKNSIKTIKEDSILLKTHFAQSSDVVPFLDTLENLATKVGIKAETASVEIAPDNLSLLVKINTFGSFESIYKFLTLLENSPYELEFTGFDIQKEELGTILPDTTISKDTKKQNSKWRATFNIKLLSFIP